MNGLLLVDKPIGMTSHDVVGKARRFLGTKAVGHAGTLDPLATGLLVLLVGQATKMSQFILNGDKSYRVKIQFGVTTDTDDITGEVLNQRSSFELTEEALLRATDELTGELELPVPIYSAIKVKGKKLYEQARKKESFEAPLRAMNFKVCQLVSWGPSWAEFFISCSKGGYIRSWSKAIGEKLGMGAVVEELRRVNSEPYGIDWARTLDELESMEKESLMKSVSWVELGDVLPHWPSLKIEGLDEKLIRNGQISRRLERFLEIQYGRQGDPVPGVKVLSKRSGQLLSLLGHEPPLNFKIRRVFPHT